MAAGTEGRDRLREAAALFLLQEENNCIGSYATRPENTPYRDWFHANEWGFLVAMRVRLALGLELPEDVADLRPIIEGGDLGDPREALLTLESRGAPGEGSP